MFILLHNIIIIDKYLKKSLILIVIVYFNFKKIITICKIKKNVRVSVNTYGCF